MYDLDLDWNGDLSVGSSGDLGLTVGSAQTKQRLLRRLLTNPGDYIWNLDYGGGLALFVGSTTNPAVIEAVIRTQISLEPIIPSMPAPTATVKALDTTSGYVTADIMYADPMSTAVANLSVMIKR
jgi:hypothetical protein